MNILCRVDSGTKIGLGHLSRMINLLSELHKDGHSIWFLCRKHEGSFHNMIPKIFGTIMLENDYDDWHFSIDDYSTWLGSSASNEIEIVNSIIIEKDIHLVIFDHYAVDEKYLRKDRKSVV